MTNIVVHNNEEAVQDKFQHTECMAHWFFVVIVSAGAVFIANCHFKQNIYSVSFSTKSIRGRVTLFSVKVPVKIRILKNFHVLS